MPIFSTNRKARYDYEIIQTIETGIELLGHEVKSVRLGRMILAGSYGIVKNMELWLLNSEITPYQAANLTTVYSPSRTRRLLVSKKELENIIKRMETERLTLVPLSVYNKNHKIKIELALARPKKDYDKRETIKRRDISREIGRKIK